MNQGNLIALIEIGGSHDECLLSQLHALKNYGKGTLLICNREIFERHPEFGELLDDFLLIETTELENNRAKTLSLIRKKLRRSKPEKVILNTAQGSLVRDLCLRFLFNKIDFIGIVHTVRKFKGSRTQQLISLKINRYLLLSKFLLDSVEPNKLTLDYFYPLRFPAFEKSVEKPTIPQIVIVGGVENRRKDLAGFARMLDQLAPEDAHFIFLGKSDPEKEEVIAFQKMLTANGHEDRVRFYEEFVSQEEFDRVLRSADLILPLVHPDTPSADQYFRNQISGAMTVSFSYKVPMLLHNYYKDIKEMNVAAFYYGPDQFKSVLSDALLKKVAKREEMKKQQELSWEYQEKRYLNFVFNRGKNNPE